MRNKILSLLVLLLTAATGAWAQSNGTYSDLNNEIGSGGDISLQYDFYKYDSGSTITISISNSVIDGNGAIIDMEGATISPVYKIIADNVTIKNLSIINYTGTGDPIQITGTGVSLINVGNNVALRPGTTNTWTITMPGSDVVLTPIYAKAAAFATTGTGSEMKMLLPAAAEGAVAGTDDPLIKEGTGIVAFAGTSTTVTQGQLKYAIGTSATDAPDLDAADTWSTTVPTAVNVDEDGEDVYVWYYIQGADAPANVAATLDNTFDNTEPVCLTVKVLSNKFDLALKAANVNTIDATQASKGTVSVKEGTGAAVNKTSAITAEGKLKAVKMGSEVKLKANNGYKFRKVEVKKTPTSLTITNGGQFSTRLDIAGCTTWDEVIDKNSDKIMKTAAGDIYSKTDQYPLRKGDGQNKVYVNAGDPFDPNATDYNWAR